MHTATAWHRCHHGLLVVPLLWGLAAAQHGPVSVTRSARVHVDGPTAARPAAILNYDYAQERVALEALYNATGGKHWTDSPGNGWLNGSCHCQWAHVQCINKLACNESPVKKIQVRVKLVGTLPSWNGDPDQGGLPHLQVLKLNNNPRLTGSLPEAWGDMTEMTRLTLHKNNLTGSLPEAWGNMTKLLRLEINTNNLQGSLPEAWRKMTKMTNLELYNNRLSGSLPEAWGSMTKIDHLELYNNLLTGSLPETWVDTMTEITDLYLSTNNLEGTLPQAWAKMTKMRLLYLSRNSLSGSLPESWSSMTEMTQLGLSSNSLSGTLPEAWGNMTQIAELYFYNNLFAGSLPEAWGKMAKIRHLDISTNDLVGSVPEAWGNMTQMKAMVLSMNGLVGSLPASWGPAMPGMQILKLNMNRLAGTLPLSWAHWNRTLATLDLSTNNLNGTLPLDWVNISSPEFSVLSLRNNSLSGTLPAAWSHLRNLSQLYLDTNQFSGSIPSSWGGGIRPSDGGDRGNNGDKKATSSGANQPYLQVVTLQSNSLTGTIPPGIINGSNLCILLLNDNRLRGPLPPLSPALFRSNCTIFSGLRYSSQFRPAILVHNNRLSCSLPGTPTAAQEVLDYQGNNICGRNNDQCKNKSTPHAWCNNPVTPKEGMTSVTKNFTNSLFLAGNRFSTTYATVWGLNSGLLPDWVSNNANGDPMASIAPFLFRHLGGWIHILSDFTIPALYLLGGALMLAIATYGVVAMKPSSSTDVIGGGDRESINMHKRTAAMHDLLLNRNMVCSGMVLALVLVPLYFSGAQYYECGDAVVTTTSAYVAAVGIEGVMVAVLIPIAVFSVVFAARFRIVFRRDDLQVEVRVRSRTMNSPDGGISACRTVWLCMLWMASLVLLLIPSAVYGMTTAVPTQDSILGKDFAVIAEVMHWAAPLIITVINSAIVPRVVDYCCDRSTWQSVPLLLVSRLLTTWVVPVVVVAIFDNSCGRMWLPLWKKCVSNITMRELDVLGPSGNTIKVHGTVCFKRATNIYQNGYIIPVVLVSGAHICNPHASLTEGRQRYAQCGRAVVEAMAPLLIGKMTLASLLLPAMSILSWRFASVAWEALVCCGLSGRCCRHRNCRCSRQRSSNDEGDGACSGEEDERDDGSTRTDDIGGVSTVRKRSKGPRLDNMVAQSLTWLDVAIVFGPHIPLLLPLVLFSLFMARWTHEVVGLRRLGLQERRAEFSKPSPWYILFSVVCQQALTAAVFIGVGESSSGSGVFGAEAEGRMALLMVIIGALASAACVAVAVVPVRWMEELGRRFDGYCMLCHYYCCRQGRVGHGRWRRASTTELPSRAQLGRNSEGGAGNNVSGGGHVFESKTPTVGAASSTLETPLLEGSSGGGGMAVRCEDACEDFRTTGACEYGDRCRFLHIA